MLRYLLALSRPRFWLYLAGPVLVGIAYGAGSVSQLLGIEAIVLFAYFLLPANIFLYGVNDVFDREIDRLNPKKDEKEVRFQGHRTVVAVVAASGLLLVPVAALLPPIAWGWLVGWLLLATGYSAPPVRFKTTPFLDSISNGLYILPGAAAYAALAGAHPPLLAVLGGWLWSMAMHTFSAIPDIEPDREAGIETTATALGHTRTYWYCGAIWGLAALAFAILDWRLGLALGVYPVLLAGIATRGVDVDRAYWWYPAVNSVIGALITVGGLWRLVYG